MIEGWITRDATALLQTLQPVAFSKPASKDALPTIEVDARRTFQPIEGFGFALTGGSAYLLAGLRPAERTELMRELFAPTPESLGLSCLRVSIGASDLGRKDFSYWGLRRGAKDPDLGLFNLTAGDREVVPMLQEILAINPAVKVIASPWSAPPWMKNNGSYIAGRLKPDCYGAYARYFVRYVEAMREHGIPITAVTPQNEPQNPKNEPSMVMSAAEQADFIANHLGPEMRKGAPDTDILCWDHNCDGEDFPLAVLGDAGAREYTAGVAWHLYNGIADAMSRVHDQYPDKKVYFTEQWVGAQENFMDAMHWHTKNVIVGALRNWCRTVLEWNLASDPEYALHSRLGAVGALGGITIAGTIKPRRVKTPGAPAVPAPVPAPPAVHTIKRNPGYYLMAHSAKFIRPGSVRVWSSEAEGLPNVVCLTPESQLVMVVMNDGTAAKRFRLQRGDASATIELGAGEIATFRWDAATAAT